MTTAQRLDSALTLHSSIPGRVRFRAPALVRSPVLAQRVQDRLRTLSGITEVEASSATGGVLARFDPASVSVATIAGVIAGVLPRSASRAEGRERAAENGPRTPGGSRAALPQPTRGRGSNAAGSAAALPNAPAAIGTTRGPSSVRAASRSHAGTANGATTQSRAAGTQVAPSSLRDPHGSGATPPRTQLFGGSSNGNGRGRALHASAREPQPARLGSSRRTDSASPDTDAPAATLAAAATSEASGEKWHAETVSAVARRLRTQPDAGLATYDAERRLKQYGRNEVPDIPRRPRTAILKEQVVSIPGLMLGAAAVFSIATGGAVDAVFIVGALTANAVIGFLTEDYAERSIQSLRQTRQPHARALRDGSRTKVDIAAVVPGDVLVLEPGHMVAADARVARSDGLTVDESLLTGESVGQAKAPAPVRPDAPMAERSDMVYAGSAVAAGKGSAIVTATGLNTELGRVRTLIGEAPDTPPPMARELQRLSGKLALLSTAACALFAVAGFVIGLPTLEILTVSASLAVSAIPEGLPAVATTTLALGMKRMRAENVVMRRLNAVAALGSGTVLCVDKTGTLTENRMTVRRYALSAGDVEVAPDASGGGVQFMRGGDPVEPQEDPALRAGLMVGALCTEAELQELPDGRLDAHGSATEEALLMTAVGGGLDLAQLRQAYPLAEMQRRAPGRNYMISIHRDAEGGRAVYVKGAPEEVLALCSHELIGKAEAQLGNRRRDLLARQNRELARRGMRVLALAQGRLAPGESWRPKARNLRWIGLVGLEDPVRGGAREAVAELGRAGIRTIMLTGDQRTTAETVARQVGLGNGHGVTVEEASAIEQYLSEGRRLPDALARVTPADKYRIVRALQERGQVVMMTGDGVNDAPALKAADVGIAMGARSTQFARDIADVILLDDNLQSVPVAVGHGRTIFDNIRKSLRFLLSSNLADICLVGASLALGLPFPLTAVQLLWMNLVTDVFPAVALAMEAGEPDVMNRPPMPPHEPLLSRPLWKTIGREAAAIGAGTFGAYLWAVGRYGPGAHARTVAFATITFAELIYAESCRSESPLPILRHRQPNRYLTACVGLTALFQVAALMLPPFRAVLGATSLLASDWLAVAAGSAAVFSAAEAMKRLPATGRQRADVGRQLAGATRQPLPALLPAGG